MSELHNQSKALAFNYIENSQVEFLDFLSHYVRLKSVNLDMVADRSKTEMRACQEWLAQEIRSWEIFDVVDTIGSDPEQPNVVARRKGSGDGQALLFNGHSDVVPVTLEQERIWHVGTPFGGEVIEGKLCGRGASDMKGGNAAFLWAIRALAATGIQLKGDLLATMVSGEETGSHKIGVDSLAESGYTAPFCIIAEPTDMQVAPANVGEFYFLIQIKGLSTSLVSRHRAVNPGPFGTTVQGVNAIDKMYKIQTALYNLDREWAIWQRHPLMAPGNMNINLSRIHAGDTYSAMADQCELTGSVLYNPALTYADVLAEITRAIDGVVQSDYWLREHPPLLTAPYVLDHKPPVNLPHDHPGCQIMMRVYRQVVGQEPVLSCMSGTTDGAYLYERGQPLLTFGAAGSDGVHGANEFVDIAKLVQSIKIYALFAIEYCGIAGLR